MLTIRVPRGSLDIPGDPGDKHWDRIKHEVRLLMEKRRPPPPRTWHRRVLEDETF
jgi:hypothetical protein